MIRHNTKLKTQSVDRIKIFFCLSLLVVITFSLYMFFLGRTIFDLVARKNAESEIRSVATNISSLELEVFQYNNLVTLQKAHDLGFVNNSEPVFISQKSFVSLR